MTVALGFGLKSARFTGRINGANYLIESVL